tara:strand:- start:178 stop:753 length:576 start_codon:yes stop_codon:yes gene_type:complete
MALIKTNARSSSQLDATILTGNLPAISGASLTGISAGITEADEWRLSANISGGATSITSNWERNDTVFDKIGTGMSESSGVFTFPSTGIYQVNWHVYATLNNAAGRVEDVYIWKTENNGGAWTYAGYMSFNLFNSGSNTHGGGDTGCIIDVTDTSNIKVKFGTGFSDSNVILKGNTDTNYSYARFIKLGST